MSPTWIFGWRLVWLNLLLLLLFDVEITCDGWNKSRTSSTDYRELYLQKFHFIALLKICAKKFTWPLWLWFWNCVGGIFEILCGLLKYDCSKDCIKTIFRKWSSSLFSKSLNLSYVLLSLLNNKWIICV